MAPADLPSTSPDDTAAPAGRGPGAEAEPRDDGAPRGALYEAAGGAGGLREAVDRFYGRVLADPVVAGRFEGVDMARLKRHQALLLAKVLGGPDEYDGRSLGDSHAGMGIAEGEYARVGEHLTTVLAELGAGEDVLAAVAATLAAVQPEIVTAGAGPGQA
jgi:hemoglobin